MSYQRKKTGRGLPLAFASGLLAMAAGAVPATSWATTSSSALNAWEAETGAFWNAVVIGETTSSGGAFLRMESSGELWVEVTSASATDRITVAYRSPDVARQVLVTLDGAPLGSYVTSVTAPGEWAALILEPSQWQVGQHMLSLEMDAGTQGGMDLDNISVCDSPGSGSGSCTGCNVAPLADPYVQDGEKRLILPPVPGVGLAAKIGVGIFSAGLKMVPLSGATIDEVERVNVGDGACSLQPDSPSEACEGSTTFTCKQQSPCSIQMRVRFKPNNYVRPPFWDSTETVTFPDGSEEDYTRGFMFLNIFATVSVECGKATNVTFKFEEGGLVLQSLSCNSCVESGGV